VAEEFAIARMIHFSVVSRLPQEAARWEPKRLWLENQTQTERNKPMMSKATRKLVLKKELLRVLDEGHLRAVNGGKDSLSVRSFLSGFGFAPAHDEYYSLQDVCPILPDPTNGAPEATPL